MSSPAFPVILALSWNFLGIGVWAASPRTVSFSSGYHDGKLSDNLIVHCADRSISISLRIGVPHSVRINGCSAIRAGRSI
jgi:hypothetical protein